MASTWSALKIELLETGANAGSWGTLTNANLGDAVLGEAITGSATVDFASDADVTITLTDSATTQAARNLRLNITESSTGIGSVRNLILGSGCQIEKFYLINNTGTGAKTIKNTSGTGISVPAGKATLVFNNGTNVVDAASYFSSLTLGSALPIASGGTGTTSTTFTNLTTNVTGTLPTANGGTGLTSFTSGGVVYASSSSALATGSALTYNGTSFGVGSSDYGNAGTINLSVGVAGTTTGGVQLWSNTTNAHSIQWGDGTTGSDPYRGAIEYAHNGDSMRFYASAAEQMRLTSTGLTIGTTTPAFGLTVEKNNGAGYIAAFRASAGNPYITLQTTGSITQIQGINSAFTDVNNIAMQLSGGNVGIGTASPSASDWNASSTVVHVNKNDTNGGLFKATSSNASFIFSAGNDVGFIATTTNSPIAFYTNTTERMRLDSSGNLGLGVTPSAWSTLVPAFQLGDGGSFISARSTNPEVYVGTNAHFNGSNYIYKTTNVASIYAQDTGSHIWYNAASGTAGNTITFAERMRLDASGNLGIGQTAPSCPLEIYRDTSSSGSGAYPNIKLNNNNATGYTGFYFFQGATQKAFFELKNDVGALIMGTGTTERARISTDGTFLVNCTATTPSGNTSIKLNTVGQIVFAPGTATTGDVAKGYINFLPYGSSTNSSNSEAWADLATGVFIDSQIEAGNTALANSALLIRGQVGGSAGPGTLIRAGTGNCGSSSFTQQFRVLYNGNVANTNGTYGTLSDARAKQDIIDASSQWDDIKAVRVRKYRLISDVERSVETGIEAPYQIGVVAQEIQQTSPGLVEVNGDESNMMTVKSSIMYMKAIKALQEAMQRIENLETEVAALKAQ
jgi:hypothetical protein